MGTERDTARAGRRIVRYLARLGDRYVDRRAAAYAAATAAVAVAANVVPAVLWALLGRSLLTATPLLGLLWVDVLFLIPPVTTLAAIVAAPLGAFPLAFDERRAAGPVVGGYAVGAVVLAGGVVASWVLRDVRPIMGFGRLATWLALLFVGTAALGALAGDAVGPLFRPPEGAAGEHPRW